jgi:WD40 repeat protein
VAFSPDGERLLTTCAGYTHRFEMRANGTSSGSSTVNDVIGRVWDVGTGKEVVALAWGPLPGTPARHEFNLGPLSIRFQTTGIEDKLGFVRTARFSPDGKTVLTAGVVGCSMGWGEERHPTAWDVSTGKPRVAFKGEQYRDVLTAAVSPDGKLVAAAGKEGVVRVWDAATGKEAGNFRGHAKLVRTVAFSPDGTRLVTASDDGTSRVWTVPGKR